jgi:hypothetical protein
MKKSKINIKLGIILVFYCIIISNCNSKNEFVKSYVVNISKKEKQEIEFLYGLGIDKTFIITPKKLSKDLYCYKLPFHNDDFYYYEPSYKLNKDTLIINLKKKSRNLFYILFLKEEPFEMTNPKFLVFEFSTKKKINFFKIIVDVYPYLK